MRLALCREMVYRLPVPSLAMLGAVVVCQLAAQDKLGPGPHCLRQEKSILHVLDMGRKIQVTASQAE